MRPDRQGPCTGPIHPIRTKELIALEYDLQRRVEIVVLQSQMIAREAPGARADFAVALEEETLDLIAGLIDLETEWNLQLIGHNLCVPQTRNICGRHTRKSKREKYRD